MTHIAEERNVAAPPEAIWRIVSDTKRWPQFFATPREVGKLRAVEYLGGATQDGPGVVRRLHFTGVPSWDEQASRWREGESITWLGVRNPWQKYWQQQIELIPGRGFTTVRWDVFYHLAAPKIAKRTFKRALEDILVASLARVDRLARDERPSPRP